jgi:WD40 repeat protein
VQKGHRDYIWTIATTPDGRRAVSGAGDHDVKVWNLETGVEIATLRGHTDVVCDVEIAGNGQTAVSASSDHTLIVWDLERATRRHTLTGHIHATRVPALRNHRRRRRRVELISAWAKRRVAPRLRGRSRKYANYANTAARKRAWKERGEGDETGEFRP